MQPIGLTPSETMIWSAAAGSLGLIVLLALVDAAYSRSHSALNTLVYLGAVWLFVLILSGLLAEIFSGLETVWLRVFQVLIGPFCGGLGCSGVSRWLSAHKRDRLTEKLLLASAAACLAGGPLCLLLAERWQLPVAAGLTVASMGVALWLSVRAAQQGDRLGAGMAWGCALGLPMQIGLYLLALDSARLSSRLELSWQVAIALAGTASFVITARMLWLRNRQESNIRDQQQSRLDPITQLYSSVEMVKKLIHAQERRARTQRDGAVMAVMVFEPERLQAQIGQYGMNEIYIQLARRMQRHTGVVNPAGRYYDRCFIVLIETMHSPKWIRTLGLRVASSLRHPLEVTSLAGERIKVQADIGVGITHLSRRRKDVDQVLHEAQSLSQAARAMPSRAAMMDPDTRQPVPVESAELGDNWKALRAQGPDSRRKATNSTLPATKSRRREPA